jgi:hypothetical protein
VCQFGQNDTPQDLCPKIAPCDNLALYADGKSITGFTADFASEDWSHALSETTVSLGIPKKQTIITMNMKNDIWNWVMPNGNDLSFNSFGGTNAYGAPLDTHNIEFGPQN